jgi:hypothetical protein
MGRLIDADVLSEEIDSWGMNDYEPLDFIDAIDDAPTVEAIPKADYENRLKADLKAILVELQLEIEEKFNDRPFSYNHHQRTEFYRDIDELIQQKINSLKEDEK